MKKWKDKKWKKLEEKKKKGESVEGKIKYINELGILIGLEGGIEGMVKMYEI